MSQGVAVELLEKSVFLFERLDYSWGWVGGEARVELIDHVDMLDRREANAQGLYRRPCALSVVHFGESLQCLGILFLLGHDGDLVLASQGPHNEDFETAQLGVN